jgi:hypothetical protein
VLLKRSAPDKLTSGSHGSIRRVPLGRFPAPRARFDVGGRGVPCTILGRRENITIWSTERGRDVHTSIQTRRAVHMPPGSGLES